MKSNIIVGITHGDYNGVGYELILKTLEDARLLELCTPVVYGSAKIVSYYRKALDMQPVPFTQIKSAADARPGQNYIINVVGEDTKIEPGVASKAAGAAAAAALEQATADLRAGLIDVLVTAPINKNTIQSDTFAWPGHTEYLEERLSSREEADGEGDSQDRQAPKALMILFNEHMRVALATVHMPLRDVPGAITRQLITERVTTLDRSLRRDFGIVSPRIAVLALNPHCGEDGMLGTEEAEVIRPAVEALRKARIKAFGPYAADGFFGAAQYRHFDGILAMYHDQGLIPLKTLDMSGGVNFTAGLDWIRTSPDHGTAFDIAGKGEASPDSLRSAIYAAIDIYRNRSTYDEATASPLRKQYYEKNRADNVVLDLSKSESAE